MKKYSTQLVIMKMRIKITVKYHYKPIRMTKVYKERQKIQLKIPSANEEVGTTRTHIH